MQRYLVEHIRKASVWSDEALLEVTEDREYVRIALTQAGRTLSIRLTKEQWRDIRVQWNESM